MPSTNQTSVRPTVALAGATGNLGRHIADTLLQPEVLSTFSSVVLLSRQEQKGNFQLENWAQKGGKVVVYDEARLSHCLHGVDVLINAIGSKGHAFKEALLRALPQTGIRLYIPSEFGVDHTVHSFPHPEWDAKKYHITIAQEVLPKSTKVIQIFIGLFLEDSIGYWFGFDTKNDVYEAVGSADTKVSFTSVGDVGRVLAVIAGMSEVELEQVPKQLHISGTSVSMFDVAKLMMNAQNVPKNRISVTTVNGAEYRKKTLESGAPNPAPYLRFLMGNGSIDHRSKSEGGIGNGNELVNLGEKRWKWKSMEDYAVETSGKPWMD